MGVTTAVGQALAEMQGTSNAAMNSRFFEDGTEIGGWQILALIGKGGNGEVYRVKRTRTGTIAALKAFYGDEPHQRSRFELETEILQKMASSGSIGASHFPRYLDSGIVVDRNIPYVVTEFLCEFVLPTQDADVAKLVLEVCEAIRGLHENGYLHRDIKPENLMCRESGEIVLIDFGLAVRITDISTAPQGSAPMAQPRQSKCTATPPSEAMCTRSGHWRTIASAANRQQNGFQSSRRPSVQKKNSVTATLAN